MNGWKLMTLGCVASGALACSPAQEGDVGTHQQALTATQNRVLGFEAPEADWSSPQGASIGASADHSEGAASLSVALGGYTEVYSVPIVAPGNALSQASLDVRVPQVLNWGETRLILQAPSQGVYWRDLGGVSLQGLSANTFHTVQFALPPDAHSVLESAATDVRFVVVLNAQGGLDAFQVDNLRVSEVGETGEPGEVPQDLIYVDLPSDLDIRDTPMAANGRLMVRDRATAIGEDQATSSTAPILLTNLGTEVTEIGAWASTGDLISRADVTIRSGADINGDVTSAGTVFNQHPEDVSGTITEGATIAGNEQVSWPQPLPSDADNPVTLGVGQVQHLDPGSYGQVTVFTDAQLHLRSGNYAFTSLQLEPNARIVLDVNEDVGPIALYLDNVVAYRGNIVAPNDDAAESFLLVYRGTQNLRLERETHMAVVAPNATVEFATGGLPHRGSVYAYGVHLEPDVTFTYVPFKYWDWILPPKPLADCVMPAGAGTFMAAFGYKNQRPAELDIKAGQLNFFSPESARGFHVLSHFRSGEFHEVVWVDMPPTGVTWEVHGQKATVDLSSPVCAFENSQVAGEVGHAPIHLHPGPSRPQIPGTARDSIVSHNALGAGTLVQRNEVDGSPVHTFSTLSQGGTPDPMWRPTRGVAPVIAQAGPRPDPILPIELELIAQADREGIWENAIVEVKATVGGKSYSRRRYDAESNHCDDGIFFWTAYRPCGAGASLFFYGGVQDLTGSVDFDFYEPDNNSADEHIWARMTVDSTAGTYQGYSDCRDCTRAHFTRDLGERRTHEDGRGNRAEWWVRQLPVPEENNPVSICATWPGAYSDNGAEARKGHVTDEEGVRAFPASYAKYSLRVVAPFHNTVEDGFLDEHGCIPPEDQVYAQQLAYIATEVTGDNDGGGIEFFLEIEGHFAVPGDGGIAELIVYDYDELTSTGEPPMWPPTPAKVVYQFTRFDIVDPDFDGELLSPAWEVQSGLAIPPDQLLVASYQPKPGSDVAGAVSQTLATLHDQGTMIPTGSYPIEFNSPGADVGGLDFTCRVTGDSYVSANATAFNRLGVEVGRASYPVCANQVCEDCSDDADCASGTCVAGFCAPEDDCRTSCIFDAQCPGGQSCLKEVVLSDSRDPAQNGRVMPGDACDVPFGPDCYCAWAPQGSSKYVVAHELGHLFQDLLAGNVTNTQYHYDCPENMDPEVSDFDACADYGTPVLTSSGLALQDPPGMADVCACNHVELANGSHCLQSIERTPAAQGEGYAQYFAAMVWNEPNTDCFFNYYKEFVSDTCLSDEPANCVTRSDGSIVTQPPVSLPCNEVLSWRNANECGASFDLLDVVVEDVPESLLDMSTELDWMTFLSEVNQSISFGDIMQVYRQACQPGNTPTDDMGTALPICGSSQTISEGCFDPELDCSEEQGWEILFIPPMGGTGFREPPLSPPLYWRDREFFISEDDDNIYTEHPPYDRGGFLDGAIRRFGDNSAEALLVENRGLAHAVADELQ